MSFLLLGLALLLAVHLLVSSGLSLLVAAVVSLARRPAPPASRGRARPNTFRPRHAAGPGRARRRPRARPPRVARRTSHATPGKAPAPSCWSLAVAGATARPRSPRSSGARPGAHAPSWSPAGLLEAATFTASVSPRHVSPTTSRWRGSPDCSAPVSFLRTRSSAPWTKTSSRRSLPTSRPTRTRGTTCGSSCSGPTPDLLALIPAGARLRADFEEAAEAAADRRAGAQVAPLTLARALLKVAALVPPDRRLEVSFAALHREGSLSARVVALVRASEAPWPCTAGPAPESRVLLLAGLAAAAVAAASSALLPLVHRLLERLVHVLA